MNREIANGMAIITPWMPPNRKAGVKQPSHCCGDLTHESPAAAVPPTDNSQHPWCHNMQVARDREAALKW